MDMTANLEAMLERGNDGAMLRFTLASRYFERGELERALVHAEVAVTLDADYSAAWRLLGRIQEAGASREQAIESFRRGIAVAEQRGDRQAGQGVEGFFWGPEA